MPDLTENQIADLRMLKQYCDQLHADLAIIGAIAYQVHFPNEPRHTADVDLAVALVLDDFAKLEDSFTAANWARVPEHRWRSDHETILDLIPAGPEASKSETDYLAREPIHHEPRRVRACFLARRARQLCRQSDDKGHSARRTHAGRSESERQGSS